MRAAMIRARRVAGLRPRELAALLYAADDCRSVAAWEAHIQLVGTSQHMHASASWWVIAHVLRLEVPPALALALPPRPDLPPPPDLSRPPESAPPPAPPPPPKARRCHDAAFFTAVAEARSAMIAARRAMGLRYADLAAYAAHIDPSRGRLAWAAYLRALGSPHHRYASRAWWLAAHILRLRLPPALARALPPRPDLPPPPPLDILMRCRAPKA
jgi:hypothetical protein